MDSMLLMLQNLYAQLCILFHTIDLLIALCFGDSNYRNDCWLECVLPPVLGGLGIRPPSDLALPAYLSSAAASETLAASVALGSPDGLSVEARASSVQAAMVAQPEGSESLSQSWQGPLDHARHERLLDGLFGPRDVARGRGASTPESADLFGKLPNSREGKRLTDSGLPVVVRLRLGLEVAVSGVWACGGQLDGLGDHTLACCHGAERLRCHAELKSHLRDAFADAGFLAVLEPLGLAAQDGRRPDRIIVAAFDREGRWLGT